MVDVLLLRNANGDGGGSPTNDPLEEVQVLIEAVQRHPCVYNRYDPLHKVTDYKHEIWKMISIEVGYDGQPVELERKWKHMRDKYVRLRKQDKHKAPIKATNKWFNYYNRMSFLDPYVEHRNRKSQKESSTNESTSPDDDFPMEDEDLLEAYDKKEIELLKTSTTSSGGGVSGAAPIPVDAADSDDVDVDEEIDVEADDEKSMQMLYKTLLKQETTSPPPPPVTSSSEAKPMTSRKRKPIPTQILPETSPSPTPTPPMPPPMKTVKTEPEVLHQLQPMRLQMTTEEALKEDPHENQVTLFIRSIARSLTDMDYRKFSMARVEISKVLYNIEYGKLHYPDHLT